MVGKAQTLVLVSGLEAVVVLLLLVLMQQHRQAAMVVRGRLRLFRVFR
jgi:hypothetical protein